MASTSTYHALDFSIYEKRHLHYDDNSVLEYIKYHVITCGVHGKKPKLSGSLLAPKFLAITDEQIARAQHLLGRRFVDLVIRRARFYERGDIVWSCKGPRGRR